MARPHPAHIITDDSAIGGKVIEKSVRCDLGSNAYFTRTSDEAGDRRTFTLSGWFKFYRTETSDVGQDFIFYSGTSLNEQFQLSREGISQINFEPKNSGSTAARFYTKTHFRDHTWYHLVLKIDTTQSTESDRMAFYVNGVKEDYDTDIVATTYPSQNLEFNWGANSERYDLMRRTISGYETNSDGAIADVHYVSGYAHDPTAFGYFDDQTGIWRPKKYTGSYGSAGWHLEFKDNSATTATTLGKDTSGNGNNWTPTNISTHDVLPDTPTNIFAVWNSVDGEGKDNEGSFSEGNLKVQIAHQGNDEETGATLSFSSGKWYWEEYMQASTADASMVGVGVKSIEGIYANGGNHWRVRGGGGESDNNGSQTNVSGFSWTTGDIIGIAVDMDNGNWTASKNGTWIGANIHTNLSGTVVPTMHNSNGSERHTFITNFGQDSSFAGTKTAQTNKDASGLGNFYYPVPSGYKALCSLNLPPSSSSVIRPKRHFAAILYTPNSSSLTIDALEFTPDFIWLKSRTQGYRHYLFDSVRGTGQKALSSSMQVAEGNDAGSLTSFNRGGFTFPGSSGFNDNGSGTDGALALCWKAGGAAVSNSDGSITSSISANTEAGFSIVTWTGNATAGATVGHGLGKAPACIFLKGRDFEDHWAVYHTNIGTSLSDSNRKLLKLNDSGSYQTSTSYWNDTSPTASVFSLGTDQRTNKNTGTFVAYCWAEIPGYSKFGQYEGNGNVDGTFVNLGFRPALVIFKSSETSENWQMKNSAQLGYNDQNHTLFVNNDNTEYTTAEMDFLSNGFKLRNGGGGSNGSNEKLIYMAWAEQPGLTPFDTFTSAR